MQIYKMHLWTQWNSFGCGLFSISRTRTDGGNGLTKKDRILNFENLLFFTQVEFIKGSFEALCLIVIYKKKTHYSEMFLYT